MRQDARGSPSTSNLARLGHEERGAILARQQRMASALSRIVSFGQSIFSIGPSDIGVLAKSTLLAARCLSVRSRQSATSSWVFSAGQRLADLLHRGRLAEIIGDVGQVAVGTGEMAFQDLGVQAASGRGP